MTFNRANKIIQPEQQPEQGEQINPNKPQPEQPEQKSFKNYTAQNLYDEIAMYPNDTWKDSPAYLELIKRLKKWDIKKLRELKYYIPNWKK